MKNIFSIIALLFICSISYGQLKVGQLDGEGTNDNFLCTVNGQPTWVSKADIIGAFQSDDSISDVYVNTAGDLVVNESDIDGNIIDTWIVDLGGAVDNQNGTTTISMPNGDVVNVCTAPCVDSDHALTSIEYIVEDGDTIGYNAVISDLLGNDPDILIPFMLPYDNDTYISLSSPDGSVEIDDTDPLNPIITVTHPPQTPHNTVTSPDGTVSVFEGVNAEGGIEYQLSASSDNVVIVNNLDGTKTWTHTSVDGVVTTMCVPTCNNTIVSEVGEIFVLESSCGWQEFDLSANDLDCSEYDEDGNLISSTTGIYVIDDIQMPENVEFTLSDEGKIWIKPRECREPFVFSLVTHILCPDGTISNSATDIFTFIPPPIGEIRVSKDMIVVLSGNNGNGQAGQTSTQGSTGDNVIITLTVCNDPSATGDIDNINVQDIIPDGLEYVSDDGGTVPGAFILSAPPLFSWGFVDAIAPGDCESIDINLVITAEDGFEFIANIVQAVADDGTGVLTQDSDIAVINETQFASATLDWGQPNGTTGIVGITSQTYTKQPSGALIPDGTPFRYVHRLEDGTIDEEITGLLGDSGSYTSTLTDGSSMLDHGFVGDFGNGYPIFYNKESQAEFTGRIYAANGESILNGNQFISDLTDLEARTFAQEITSTIYVGGQGSLECPIESEGYNSTICKVKAFSITPITSNIIIGLTATYTAQGVGQPLVPHEIQGNINLCSQELSETGGPNLIFGYLTSYTYDDNDGSGVHNPPYEPEGNCLQEWTGNTINGLTTSQEELMYNSGTGAWADYSAREIFFRQMGANSCDQTCFRPEITMNLQTIEGVIDIPFVFIDHNGVITNYVSPTWGSKIFLPQQCINDVGVYDWRLQVPSINGEPYYYEAIWNGEVYYDF